MIKKLPYTTLKILGLTLAAAQLLPTTAQGALIAYDGFDTYANGDLTDDNGGTGWIGAWDVNTITANVVDGGLSYSNGEININGGAKAVDGFGANTDNEMGIVRQFTPTDANGDIYFSYLVQPRLVSGDAPGGFFYRMYLSNTTSRNDAGGGVGDLSTTEPWFGARIGKTGPTDLIETPYASGYGGATTYLLVGKLSSTGGTSYDQLEMWVNPSTVGLGAADITINSSTGETVMNYYGLRSFQIPDSGDVIYDELRIGTTAGSVVPEPSTYALVAGALSLFGVMLRRRK